MDLRLQALPLELVLEIFSYSSRSQKARIAQSSKAFYDAILPMLYNSIKLSNPNTGFLCCKTIATADDKIVSLVRSWEITGFSAWYFSGHQRTEFLLNYRESIKRLSSLQYYTCSFFANADILEIVLSKQSLRFISLSIQSAKTMTAEDYDHIGSLRPTFPHLHTLKIYCSGVYPSDAQYARLIQYILFTHSNQFTSLSLQATSERDPNFLQKFIPSNTSFSSLEYLAIEPPGLAHLTSGSLPNIRKLRIRGNDPLAIGQLSVPTEQFLSLEYYLGPGHLVPHILRTPRPIKTLYLDGAWFPTLNDYHRSFDPYGSFVSLNLSWAYITSIMPHFTNSTGPLRTLGLKLGTFDIDELPELASYARTLEVLLICLPKGLARTEKFAKLGPRFFANMPCLHTFLLGDVTTGSRPSPFQFMQSSIWQEQLIRGWGRSSPSLQTVAFNSHSVWRKRYRTWEQLPIDASQEE